MEAGNVLQVGDFTAEHPARGIRCRVGVAVDKFTLPVKIGDQIVFQYLRLADAENAERGLGIVGVDPQGPAVGQFRVG